MRSSTAPVRSRLGEAAAKAHLAIWVWWTYLVVSAGTRGEALPDLVTRLSTGRGSPPPGSVARFSRATDRSLRLGPWELRCLPRALVLFRLLRLRGEPAELVIGLPSQPDGHRAHAWVEVGGMDVGPPPGAQGHAALARFPA